MTSKPLQREVICSCLAVGIGMKRPFWTDFLTGVHAAPTFVCSALGACGVYVDIACYCWTKCGEDRRVTQFCCLPTAVPCAEELLQGRDAPGGHWPQAPEPLLCIECGRNPRLPTASSLWWLLRVLWLLVQCRFALHLPRRMVWEEQQAPPAP